MNKQQLINKIKNIEGLSNEEKAQLTELLNSEKKYGLVWENKPEDIEKRLENELPVLQEVKERAIISSAPDAPNHILIEGDNLEALTALSYTHSGKIDVIYIDPPYNTGNKDFVYNDNFVDREDGYRHSKWLSFMNKRLRIAKGLLSDKGVIFISIDDNEQAQLKLLCDEIFGENNFICDFIRTNKTGSGHDAREISIEYDYMLFYAKNKQNITISKMIIDTEYDKKYKYIDNFLEKRGKYYLRDLDYKGSYSQSLDYPIKINNEDVYAGGVFGRPNTWRWSKQKVEWGIENGFVVIDEKKKKIYIKQYQYVDNNDNKRERTLPYNAQILFLNSIGSTELKNILNQNIFSFPKPTSLVEFTMNLSNDKNITILDFFAGSGTTLHATMQLNNEDGGKRQCILVTNNENGICENVTYERNKRVINGYTTPKGENIAGLKDNTLRYYKTHLLPREKTTANMRRLMLLATDMLCIRNNVYTPAPLADKYLDTNTARYFNDGKHQMLVVYNEEKIPELVKQILKSPTTENKIKTYVFSPNSYAFDDDFDDVANRVELCALPDAIYNAYRHVLPEPKKQAEETNENNETTEKL